MTRIAVVLIVLAGVCFAVAGFASPTPWIDSLRWVAIGLLALAAALLVERWHDLP